VAGNSGHNRLTLDLPAETITIEGDGRVIRFEIDPLRKDALVRGLDPVGSALEYADDIRRFEQAFHAANPWLA
jgi:3-isopropylmalate/(R)-2-methylmalate dehydratase small subunit